MMLKEINDMLSSRAKERIVKIIIMKYVKIDESLFFFQPPGRLANCSTRAPLL